MNGLSSSDSMAEPTLPSQQPPHTTVFPFCPPPPPLAQPQLAAISEAPDAGMLHNHTLALLMMQQMAMPQFLFSPFIQIPPLAEVTHTPFGPIQMPQPKSRSKLCLEPESRSQSKIQKRIVVFGSSRQGLTQTVIDQRWSSGPPGA